MRQRSGRGVTIALLLLALMLAGQVAASAAEGELQPSPNTQFAQIAEQVPEFGGAWVEGDAFVGEEEILHLWMVEPNQAAEQRARELLVELLGDRFDQESVVVHDGALPFSQLAAWFAAIEHRAGPPLPRPGHTGIREQINRIVIGLPDPERDAPAWRAALDELGIPQEAVFFEENHGYESMPLLRPWWQSRDAKLILLILVLVTAGWLVLRRRRELVASPDA